MHKKLMVFNGSYPNIDVKTQEKRTNFIHAQM